MGSRRTLYPNFSSKLSWVVFPDPMLPSITTFIIYNSFIALDQTFTRFQNTLIIWRSSYAVGGVNTRQEPPVATTVLNSTCAPRVCCTPGLDIVCSLCTLIADIIL